MNNGYNGGGQSTQEVRYMKGGNDLVAPCPKGRGAFYRLRNGRKTMNLLQLHREQVSWLEKP
jgi:hypothetical protein